VILSSFQSFSTLLIVECSAVLTVSALILSRHRNLPLQLDVAVSNSLHLILVCNLVLLVLHFHLFPSKASIASAGMQIPFEITLASSLAYGVNSQGPPLTHSVMSNVPITHYNLSMMFTAAMAAAGAPLRVAVVVPRVVLVVSTLLGLSLFGRVYSEYSETVWLGVVQFLVAELSNDEFFAGNNVFCISSGVFGLLFLCLGIVDRFKEANLFLLSGLFLGPVFLASSDGFVSVMLFVLFLVILTFPYSRPLKWRGVLSKVVGFMIVVGCFLTTLSFYCDVLLCYSVSMRLSKVTLSEMVLIGISFIACSSRIQFRFNLALNLVFALSKVFSFNSLAAVWTPFVAITASHSVVSLYMKKPNSIGFIGLVGFLFFIFFDMAKSPGSARLTFSIQHRSNWPNGR
jgi:hypothetical protein